MGPVRCADVPAIESMTPTSSVIPAPAIGASSHAVAERVRARTVAPTQAVEDALRRGGTADAPTASPCSQEPPSLSRSRWAR
jgi:hypothetical protein